MRAAEYPDRPIGARPAKMLVRYSSDAMMRALANTQPFDKSGVSGGAVGR